MSYCRFENTLSDLRDCAENIWDTDLSDEERRARKSLIILCRKLAEIDEDEIREEDDEE